MGKKNKQAKAKETTAEFIGPAREQSPSPVAASSREALKNRIRTFYNAGLIVPRQLLEQPGANAILMEIVNGDDATPSPSETATSTSGITVNLDPNSTTARSNRFKEARRQLENAWRSRRPYGHVDVHNRLDSTQWKLLATETSVDNPNIYTGGIAPEPPHDDGLFDTRATLAVEEARLQGLLSIFDKDEPEERLEIPERYALQANLMPINREGHYIGAGTLAPPTSRLAFRLKAYEELKEDLLLLAKPSKAASDSNDARRARVSRLEEMAHTMLMMNVHQLQRLARMREALESLRTELHLDVIPERTSTDGSMDDESAADSDEPARALMRTAIDNLARVEISALLSFQYTRNMIHQARYNAGEMVTSAKLNKKRFVNANKAEKRQKKAESAKGKKKGKAANSSQQAP